MGDIQEGIVWITDKKFENTIERISLEIGLRILGCISTHMGAVLIVWSTIPTNKNKHACCLNVCISSVSKEEIIEASFPFAISGYGQSSKNIIQDRIADEWKTENNGFRGVEPRWVLRDPIIGEMKSKNTSDAECRCSPIIHGHTVDCAYVIGRQKT